MALKNISGLGLELTKGAEFLYTDSNGVVQGGAWSSVDIGGLNDDIGVELTSNKGQANGYVPLDSSSLIPTQYMPPLVVVDTFVVASEAAMLALSSAEQGDIAVRTDVSKTFILTNNDPTSVSNWQELLSPSGGVSSVNGLNGPVQLDLSFTPSTGLLGLTGSSDVDLGFTSADISEWDAAYANIISGLTFDSSTGDLTASRPQGGDYVTNLDGRYLQSYAETDTLDSVTSRGNTTTNSITVASARVNGYLDISSRVRRVGNTGTYFGFYSNSEYRNYIDNSEKVIVNSSAVETTNAVFKPKGGMNVNTFTQPASSVFAGYLAYDSSGDVYKAAGGVQFVADDAIGVGALNTTNTPSSGQVLQYNGANLTWATVTSGGVTSLNDIGDVSVPSPNTNDVLSWNGSTWVASAAGGGSGDGVVTGATFTSGTLALQRSLGLGDVSVSLDGRYLLATHPASGVTTAGIAEWDAAYTNLISGLTFDSATGNLTATRPQGGDYVANLDGRYLDDGKEVTSIAFTGSSTKTLTLTFADASTLTASFIDSGGGTGVADGVVDSASFNTSNGELTLTRTEGLADIVVDLDGRYSTFTSFFVQADTTGSGSIFENNTLQLTGGAGISTARTTPLTGYQQVTFNIEDDGVTESMLNIANSPTNGFYLRYDAGNLVWAPVSGGSVASLNDIGDVSVPSPATNDVLSWNGSSWVSTALSGGGTMNSFFVQGNTSGGSANNEITNGETLLIKGTGALTSSHGINANEVTMTITNGGVGTLQLADSAVTTAKIADSAVTEAKLAANSVTTTKVSDDAITEAKLDIANTPTNGQVLTYDAGDMVWVTPSGGGGTAIDNTAHRWYSTSLQTVTAGATPTTISSMTIAASGNGTDVSQTSGKFVINTTGIYLVSYTLNLENNDLSNRQSIGADLYVAGSSESGTRSSAYLRLDSASGGDRGAVSWTGPVSLTASQVVDVRTFLINGGGNYSCRGQSSISFVRLT